MFRTAQKHEFEALDPVWDLETSAKTCPLSKCANKSSDDNECRGVLDDITFMSYELYRTRPEGEDLRHGAFIAPRQTNGKPKNLYVLANLRARESPGINVNMMSNIVLAHNNNPGRIVAAKRDLPAAKISEKSHVGTRNKTTRLIIVTIFLQLGCGLMVVLLAALILFEKYNNLKAQQFICGLKPIPYLLAHFSVDAVVILLALTFVLIAFFIGDYTPWIGTEYHQLTFVIVLFMLFAIAQPLFVYVVTSAIPSANFLSSFIYFANVRASPTLWLILRISFDQLATKDDTNPHLDNFMTFLLWFARLIPTFPLADGLADVAQLVNFWKIKQLASLDNAYYAKCRQNAGLRKRESLLCSTGVFDIEYGPARALMMLAGLVLLYASLLVAFAVLKNSSAWNRFWSIKRAPLPLPALKDDDVLAEEAKIAQLSDEKMREYAICVKNVRKVHKSQKTRVHALQGISFAVEKGEVFGLLGVNGAGKSTLFKMLAGELTPMPQDDSELYVNKGSCIGYCPQTDPIYPFMTVREHLVFTAHLRGIPSCEVSDAVSSVMRALDLTMYDDNFSDTLSGGNKRKLCVAMSLIGTPKILFLDEPSCGVDPVARRFMWGVIQQVSQRDRTTTVILTTHSMEECEALATRTVIMVNGVFRCIGPNSHIRNAYGQNSFTLDVSFPSPTEEALGCVSAHWAQQLGVELTADYALTYAQLTQLCAQSEWHHSMLHSTASIFPAIVDFCAQKKKLDQLDANASALLASASVSLSSAAVWWHMCNAAKDFLTEVSAKINETKKNRTSSHSPQNGSKDPYSGMVVEEIHGVKVRLCVALSGDANGTVASIGDLFGAMESCKDQSIVEDYFLGGTTLESIFNKFSKEQVNNTERVACFF